jgi:hypothetical protein
MMQSALDGDDAPKPPAKDSLYFSMQNWYLRRSLFIQIEEVDKGRRNYIEFIESVKQPLPAYHDSARIKRRF